MKNSNSRARLITRYTVHLLTVVIIIYVGYLITQFLMKTKPKVRKRTSQREAFVKTIVVTTKSYTTNIATMGTITPSQRIDVFPQISGKLLSVSPSLVPGGFLKKGSAIAKINPINEKRNVAEAEASLAIADAQLKRAQQDYQVAEQRLVVEQKKAKANLKSATKQYENALQQSQRQEQLLQRKLTSEEVYEVAKTTTIQKNSELENARLRLSELQTEREALKLKKQDIVLAKQQVSLQLILLEKAQQNLKYTNITTPFDAFVIEKRVGLGSTVTEGTNIATIVAVDYYWVEATIPVRQLSWITLPRSGNKGSVVKVTDRSWAKNIFREGSVERLLPQLEPEGKMAKLLIRIKDPLLRSQTSSEKPILLLGSFVRLEIKGRTLNNVIQISRQYLQDGRFLWVLVDNQLQKRLINIVWREKDYVFVDSGIASGEKMIVSQIPGAVVGMVVKEIQ
ncbi:efflux RND transporter periplasmic adaptor subunit [Candidatus Uabimicrobium sp. HlEnr_7]|uniref:efflux RND transporter periplasmic adaptor subunit n=1 Tax=Candidatus Uabimicrobium helgolandensis TaxID=3095367 RepID=UPI00355887FB